MHWCRTCGFSCFNSIGESGIICHMWNGFWSKVCGFFSLGLDFLGDLDGKLSFITEIKGS